MTGVFGFVHVLYFLLVCVFSLLMYSFSCGCVLGTAVQRNGWGTGIRTQIEGTAHPHAVHYTMPQWIGNWREAPGFEPGSRGPKPLMLSTTPCLHAVPSETAVALNVFKRSVACTRRSMNQRRYTVGAVVPHFGCGIVSPLMMFVPLLRQYHRWHLHL